MTVTPAGAGVASDVAPTRRRDAQPRARRRRGGPLAIAQAIPADHARARGQRQWLAEVRSHPATASLRADAHRNLLAVADGLAAYADWNLMTSRPTWGKLQERTGLARRTVARWLAWLHEAGLLATVVHGTTSDFSPGILRPKPGEVVCEAAVYVLIYRPQLTLIVGEAASSEVDQSDAVDETGTPSGSPKGTSPARTRPKIRNRQDDASNRPEQSWPADQRPASKVERQAAAAEAQRRCPLLRRISTAYVAALLREAHLAGWNLADVLHALDTRPDGSPWLHTTAVRNVPGFVRYRLDAWRNLTDDGSGPFLPSSSQRARAEQARLQALARARAAAHIEQKAASTPPVDASSWADRVRAELRAARTRQK